MQLELALLMEYSRSQCSQQQMCFSCSDKQKTPAVTKVNYACWITVILAVSKLLTQ